MIRKIGGKRISCEAVENNFLQPFMKAVTSFIANSTQLINTLSQSHFPPDCLLATLGVSSLYTNISHEDAIATIHNIYSQAPPSPYRPPILILSQLLLFALKITF